MLGDQAVDRFPKREPAARHAPVKDGASAVTAEAVPAAFGRVDAETRLAVALVEGAEPDPLLAPRHQLDPRGLDHRLQVDLPLEALQHVVGDAGHQGAS